MIEVVDKNFKDIYPKVEEAIKKASIIAIDAEFTGIQSDDVLKYSLFDTISARYEKLRKNIESFAIVQCGIVTFQHVPDQNVYNAESFNFYLVPRAIPFKNKQFTWQVAALEFLSYHQFDFNKCINTGISYLNKEDEQLMKQYLEDNLMDSMDHLTLDEEEDFKAYRHKISEWMSERSDEISYKIQTTSPILQYMLHKELRNSYTNIWTISEYKALIVIKVSPDMRKILENEEGNNTIEADLLNSYLGFSKVFQLLSSSRKPIIGHNTLLDLMFMHQQFYKPLPSSYSEFKNNVHTLFPVIYDTKFLSFELKKMLDKKEVSWKISTLGIVYEFFKDKGRHLGYMSPHVKLNDECPELKVFHNAGWDAYCAGFIFIKMAHLFCIKKYGEGIEQKFLTHSELMSSVKQFVNSINIPRSNEIYLKLDGEDPVLTKSEWLHVKLKSPSYSIKDVAEKFSFFGSVDVMPFARKRVLVAVANRRSALDILQHFKNNSEIQVARYNPIKHAKSISIILWTGVVFSGGMFVWTLQRIFKKSV